MSNKEAKILKAPRGCPDWLPEQAEKAEWILSKAREVTSLYGFRPYQTPIFENSQVFTRTLGDTSDIVTKEMYSFEDRNGESYTLRPEGTAPLVRMFISNKLQRELPLKVFYSGPMFRYERPQKGRQRQFHQIGVEYLGASKSLLSHFEVLKMAWQWLLSLEIKSNLKLYVNAIGSIEERNAFRDELVKYLKPHLVNLSEESKERLIKNPLRILDSKSDEDKKLLIDAPVIRDFISDEKRAEIDELIAKLKNFDVDVELDTSLVRGLDYYNDLVFEIKAESDLGAQNTVLAGGRYDNLIEEMGGASTPSLGWAAGLERLMLLSSFSVTETLKVGVLLQQPNEEDEISLSNKLRSMKIPVFIPIGGNFSKRMQKIQKQNCSHAVIFGEDEKSKGTWTVKNLKNGEQEEVKPEEFIKKFI